MSDSYYEMLSLFGSKMLARHGGAVIGIGEITVFLNAHGRPSVVAFRFWRIRSCMVACNSVRETIIFYIGTRSFWRIRSYMVTCNFVREVTHLLESSRICMGFA